MEDTLVLKRPAGAEGRRDVLSARDAQGGGRYEYIAGELLVATEDVPRITGALRAEGAERVRDIYGMVVFRLPSGQSVPDVVDRLRALDGAAVVTPNHVLRPALHDFWGASQSPDPVDPLPDLPDGHDLPGSGVTVGVLDTGLSLRDWFKSRARRAHPGEVDAEKRDQIQPGTLDWEAGHGTHVTGIILQHAPGADVVVWGVGDRGHLNDAAANEAIVELVRDHDVDILNLSFGRPAAGKGDRTDEAMRRAIEAARVLNPDLVVVAAAGNRHDDAHPLPDADPEFVPASYPGVVAVGAVDSDSQIAGYSCRGSWVTCSSLGDEIASTFIEWHGPVFAEPPEPHPGTVTPDRRKDVKSYCGYAKWSGTSFSAARITGGIAAAASPQGQGKGSLLSALQDVLPAGGRTVAGGGLVVNPINFVVPAASAASDTRIESVPEPVA